MSRPSRNTVEFFPHFVNSGKTLFTIEQRFGNDGYAFLFKVLEILGLSENHFIDCRNPADWEFLLAKTKVSEESAEKIIETLVKLGTFDEDLWHNRIIFSENFLTNLKKLYERRKSKCMHKPDLCIHLSLPTSNNTSITPITETNDNILPQSKVEYSRVKESIYVGQEKLSDVCIIFKEKFEKARKLFGGTKRGLDVEYENWLEVLEKNNLQESEEIDKLLPAIQKRMEAENNAKTKGTFFPPWKNFKTWIFDQCWTETFGTELSPEQKAKFENALSSRAIRDSFTSEEHAQYEMFFSEKYGY